MLWTCRKTGCLVVMVVVIFLINIQMYKFSNNIFHSIFTKDCQLIRNCNLNVVSVFRSVAGSLVNTHPRITGEAIIRCVASSGEAFSWTLLFCTVYSSIWNFTYDQGQIFGFLMFVKHDLLSFMFGYSVRYIILVIFACIQYSVWVFFTIMAYSRFCFCY